jgi:3-oxoacyl-[acyl-carrier-protein] synthase-3
MRIDPPLVVVATSWLPPNVQTAAEAGTAGLVDPVEAGYQALPVADEHLAAPDMAVNAAARALTMAGLTGAEVGQLTHAWSYYQGHDFWSPAHYVADRIGASAAVPIGIQQLCNGGAAAVQLAAACLAADQGLTVTLVTTADRFAPPAFDRWRGDYGVAYGDGGTAAVLRRASAAGTPTEPGLLLLSVTSTAATRFEAMHRGDDPFAPAPRWWNGAVDVRRTKRAYLAEHGLAAYLEAERANVLDVVAGALADAGVGADDPRLRWAALPRFSREVLAEAYHPVLKQATTAEPLDLGAWTGHLGAGDLIANIGDLTPRLRGTGKLALVLSAGAGFTWSCAVVQG